MEDKIYKYMIEQKEHITKYHGELIHKFVIYFKKTAHYYTQLQNYKRQLASFINSINYTLPFLALDVDRKGRVTQQNIQHFLIKHKYFVKPVDINRYFQKYVHDKNVLLYEDILECLLPHSDYILMASTAKSINQILLQKETSKYFCKRVDNEVIKNMVAIIVTNQISFLKNSFMMIDDITNDSLKVGPLLWRLLDRNHDNHLDLKRMSIIGKEYGQQIAQNEWIAFINWHFRSHTRSLNRQDFMLIFNNLIKNKRNKSACNYEHFVQKQIQKKFNQSMRQYNKNIMSETKSKILKNQNKENFGNMHGKSKGKRKNKQEVQKGMISLIDPNQIVKKRLLYSKLGYKNPEHLVKLTQFS